ncbi:MAG: hypothetical protein U0103_18560, partial [Candidatus Obscuribacterales bacterium]
MKLEPPDAVEESSAKSDGNISDSSDLSRKPLEGAFYAVLAYGFWGVVPVYWKLIGGVPAMQTVSH